MATDFGAIEAENKKLQDAHDKKVALEVKALLKEAEEKKVYVSETTTNPEAIRKLIDSTMKKREIEKKTA